MLKILFEKGYRPSYVGTRCSDFIKPQRTLRCGAFIYRILLVYRCKCCFLIGADLGIPERGGGGDGGGGQGKEVVHRSFPRYWAGWRALQGACFSTIGAEGLVASIPRKLSRFLTPQSSIPVT